QHGLSPWPWIAGWLGLSALLLRHGTLADRFVLQRIAGGALGIGLGLLHLAHGDERMFVAWPLYLAAMLAIAVGMQVLAIWRSSSPERDETERGAALLALFLLLSLGHVPAPVNVPLLFVSILVFGFLVVLAQTRLGLGDGYLIAML